jgi:NAD dependent epimerase/dehydratase family enzyme
MKVILTGSTGFIGQEVLHQCIQQPKITSILVLSRRALPTEVTANNSKVKVVMVNDFRKYSDDIVQDFRDADACIW